MSDRDRTNDSSADFQREKRRFSRESDDADLNVEKDTSSESDSESVTAKKARVSDSTEEKESGLVVERDDGFLEKNTVSRENDTSVEKRVGMIEIDLNFPPLDAAEGEEAIYIDLENGDERDIGNKGEEIEGRCMCFGFDLGKVEVDPYGEGSDDSRSGRRRYTREEKGKGKVGDDWLSIATAGSLDLGKKEIKLWIGPS
ncbi:hypothetical protein L1049_018542 [Liquidambar formosana]|uniref:Uncharacterized protein n=1 Tax=Liquidambar formosana TaxID=63359 RepID=A0AAP0RA80_LIQFO